MVVARIIRSARDDRAGPHDQHLYEIEPETEERHREVAAAFPEDDVRLRILLDEPRKRRLPAGGGKDRVRVQ